MAPHIQVKRVEPREIDQLRELYRQEMNCQIVHDSYHRRGFVDPYVILARGRTAGYAAVTNGSHPAIPAATLKEAYLSPAHRSLAHSILREVITSGRVSQIEAQSNDTFLMLALFDFAEGISSDKILFHDAYTTYLTANGVAFRRRTEAAATRIFEHRAEPVGDWLLEIGGDVVGTGGFLTHYNPPYGDIYMEVVETRRRQGLGSFLVQELKRVCYEAGYRPAARCNPENVASRRTLERAGLLPCARILRGRVRPPNGQSEEADR